MVARDFGAIWVAGHADGVLRSDGVAAVASDLGARIRTLDLWGEPLDGGRGAAEEKVARLLIVEVLDRPDLLQPALKTLRAASSLRECPVLAVVRERSITRLDPASGHDDFMAWPAPPSELYARIRQLEWRSSEYATDDIVKLGPLVIHTGSREVSIGAGEAEPISLTAREFALLLALATRRGRVLTRETLLDVVWGSDYEGGAKTVDVHVRRLRAKLGEALPLHTVRGAGYMLR